MKKVNFLLSTVLSVLLISCEKNAGEIDPTVQKNNEAVAANAMQISATGELSVLTYNVAGLPSIISSGNPEENTSRIGELVNDYDIVHVQEDFNYHAALYEKDNHPYATPTSGGVPFGDGLNTMSLYSFTDFQRVKWNDCNGTDCLTPKGFTVARHLIAPGVFIDFYNAHPNAGVAEADLAARRSNIIQLKNFINTFSAGNAVILMGDLNCRYTRTEDNIRELKSVGLKDVWVELIRGGEEPAIGAPALVCDNSILYGDPQCEIVDRIFYRGNAFLSIVPTVYSFEEEKFRNENGEMLSDHRPINVKFKWEANKNFIFSDQFGGPHGNSFNDVNFIPLNPLVEKVAIRAGSRLDMVAVNLAGGVSFEHGGSNGTLQELVMQNQEYVNEVVLHKGQKSGRTRIFRAEFKTNFNRVLAGGSSTNDTVKFTAPTGWQIVGFHGRAGDEVDKLGVIFAPAL